MVGRVLVRIMMRMILNDLVSIFDVRGGWVGDTTIIVPTMLHCEYHFVCTCIVYFGEGVYRRIRVRHQNASIRMRHYFMSFIH